MQMLPLAQGSLGRQTPPTCVGPFVLSVTSHQAGLELPRHAHERASVNVVLQGGYAETVRGGSVIHAPMTLVVKPPGETHANHFRHAGARCLLIEVGAVAPECLDAGATLFERPRTMPAGLTAVAALRVTSLLRSPAPPVDLLEALVYELIGTASGTEIRETRPPPWLQRVRDQLHDSNGRPACLDTLAAAVDRHPMHVARAFRCFYHTSVGDYARRLRLERTARDLARPEHSLSVVAVGAGYYDHSHLTREFRRLTGWTPSAYRRAVRHGD